jgi:hypothetical protein
MNVGPSENNLHRRVEHLLMKVRRHLCEKQVASRSGRVSEPSPNVERIATEGSIRTGGRATPVPPRELRPPKDQRGSTTNDSKGETWEYGSVEPPSQRVDTERKWNKCTTASDDKEMTGANVRGGCRAKEHLQSGFKTEQANQTNVRMTDGSESTPCANPCTARPGMQSRT